MSAKRFPTNCCRRRDAKTAAGTRRRGIPLSAYADGCSRCFVASLRPARAFRANQPALDVFPIDALGAGGSTTSAASLGAICWLVERPSGIVRCAKRSPNYLNTSRGVKCTADQVLIISGVQQALDRAAHLLLDPGDPVWMEEPGYPGAAVVFRAVGAKICAVPVDAEGLNLEAGRRRWPQQRPRLVYVTPAHQFPLGVTMSLRRRLSLLEWARRSRTHHLRRRLRQRIPIFRASNPRVAGFGSGCGGDLCRQLH